MPSSGQRRSPPLPHVASPISCTARRNRLVSREDGSSSSGSRSVKTFREQVASSKKELSHGQQEPNGTTRAG